jgi:hypothetical protein
VSCQVNSFNLSTGVKSVAVVALLAALPDLLARVGQLAMQ